MYLFVGEKPSRLAFERGLTWKDGGLAAKTLFDALRAINVSPAACGYVNLFGDHPDAPETVSDNGVLRTLAAAADAGVKVVAMGRKVERWLVRSSINHMAIAHPAARGTIRGKEAYQIHVRTALNPETVPPHQ